MAELLTDEIIKEKLEMDGFMEEPDGPWLLEYIETEYGGKLDNTSDFIDDKYTLKIYSESTVDCYDIYWCTLEARPYVSQDGYYYEDYSDWSDKAVDELCERLKICAPVAWGYEKLSMNKVWETDYKTGLNYEIEAWGMVNSEGEFKFTFSQAKQTPS